MLDELNQSLEQIVMQTQQNLSTLLIIIAVPWIVFIVSRMVPKLLYLGIIPRKVYGLPGIVCSPFLHANFNHLFFNSIPLVVLANFLLIKGVDYFLIVTVFITLTSGFLLWCFGKPGIHVGASGLITGYWGLLVADIYQQGSLTAIILGVLSAYYFAGIFFGIFPSEKGVSWEGHLFGLVAGLGLSYLISLPI